MEKKASQIRHLEEMVARLQEIIAEQEQTIERQKETIQDQTAAIEQQKKLLSLKDSSHQETRAVLRALLSLLTKLVELRDPYTEGHSQRVAQLAAAIAERAGFSEEKIRLLQYGCLLHDVGKIAINDFVLNKPTMLTRLERLMIEQHVEIGYELIEPLGLDPMIMNIVRYHHENFDGSGYPRGLRGEQIPAEARIVRLADMYDALTTNRPYRDAYTKEEAWKVMAGCAECFDPYFRAIFKEVLQIED